MTIILFLVDNSASMNQRTYLGTTLLDVTKSSIETFQKIRSKNPGSKMDRLMLLTYDEHPGNIKAGWKENHVEFNNQLKNLSAQGTTDIGPAIKSAFDMLNMNRNQSGIDTYGQGRCPFYIEPALIVCFTDGNSMVTQKGIEKQLTLPMANGLVGSELTKEPFRWDQRVFGVVLKFPAVEIPDLHNESTFVPAAESCSIDSMCDVTGGRSYLVSSPRQLSQTLESLAQKAGMHGVVVNFDYIESPLPNADENIRPSTPTQPNTAAPWKSTKKMIFVKTSVQRGHSVGHWPIPESYWPDAKAKNLPARDAQPYVKFSSPVAPPAAHQMNNLPVDVYELEPSPLTQHILKYKSNQCYQTFIAQSSKYSEHPFGFLQANNNTQKVFLHVMPYNYPVFLTLLDELHKLSMKVTPKWKADFDNYLRSMPGYYAQYLRRALGRMSVHSVVPESLDNCLSFAVVSHLKQVRIKAKQEYETLIASVGQGPAPTEFIHVTNKNCMSLLARQDFTQLLQYTGGDFSSLASLQKELVKYESFPIAVPRPNTSSAKSLNFRNPYDISRGNLLSHIYKLRSTLLHPKGEAGAQLRDEHLHSLPIHRMGNYHEYLAKVLPPLRKLDTQPERVHTFGNPFKVNKNLMIDEADEAMPGMAVPGGTSPKRSKREASDMLPNPPAKKKRKPGPLPRHITLTNRPTTPPIPPANPLSPAVLRQPASLTNGDDEEPEIVEINSALAVVAPENSPASLVADLPVMLGESPSKHLAQPKDDVNGILKSKQNGVNSEQGSLMSSTQFSVRVIQHRKNSTERSSKSPNGPSNDELLKNTLIKSVKRPGKSHKELFDQLSNLKGSLDERGLAIDKLLYECYRFKRFQLMEDLTVYKKTMVEHMSPVEGRVNGHTSQPEPEAEKTVKKSSKTYSNKSIEKKVTSDKKVKKVVNQSGKT